MPTTKPVEIETPAPTAISPYGWMLGKPFPTGAGAIAFSNTATAFWQEHLFDPGTGGEVEILWVTYQNDDPTVARLEKHHVTQQAVVPLLGDIVQILALSTADGEPDLDTLRAFRLTPGVGVCMRPGVWHATRSSAATCLMLTRRSTTVDLILQLTGPAPPQESTMQDIVPIHLHRDDVRR